MQANLQQGTLLRNHYSPNRAASQVSMKYRVKRNQCQDLIHKPNQHSRSGQKMNRVKRYPTSGQGQTRHKPVHMPSLPPQQSGQPRSQHKVQGHPIRQKSQDHSRKPSSTAGQVCMREKVIRKTSQDLKPPHQNAKGMRNRSLTQHQFPPSPHTHTTYKEYIAYLRLGSA